MKRARNSFFPHWFLQTEVSLTSREDSRRERERAHIPISLNMSNSSTPTPLQVLATLGVNLKADLFPITRFPTPDSLYQHIITRDLKTIALPMFPKIDASVSKKQLGNSGILVQLEKSPENISVSLDERKLVIQNSDQAAHGAGHRRMLRFILSDGSTTVQAYEYLPIPQLDSRTKPGVKLLLKSNEIEVCKGKLMLTNSNIRVIDGSGY